MPKEIMKGLKVKSMRMQEDETKGGKDGKTAGLQMDRTMRAFPLIQQFILLSEVMRTMAVSSYVVYKSTKLIYRKKRTQSEENEFKGQGADL